MVVSAEALRKTRRYIRTSTHSRRRSALTSMDGGCTRRWLTGRPRTRSQVNSSSYSTLLGSGRRPTRSFTRGPGRARSARTRIEREFYADAARRLKADAAHDISVDGPELAAQAIRAGLVDVRMIVCPAVVGGGKRFFPDAVRLDLGLLEERRFDSGVVILRYGIQWTAGR